MRGVYHQERLGTKQQFSNTFRSTLFPISMPPCEFYRVFNLPERFILETISG